jgi:hypothetical protein
VLLLLLCLFRSVAVAVYVSVVPSGLRVTVLCEEVSLDFLVAVGRTVMVEVVEAA